ncbi:hypothetical protein Tco_1349942, partial [Tanacetum coccineum]
RYIDIDDLYNNLRVYEDEMKRSSSSTSTSQNLAFLSSENTSSTNEVSTTSGDFEVSTAGGINQVSSTPCAHDVARCCGWPLVLAVLGQMANLVAITALNSTSIGFRSFLPLVLLWLVVIVAVVGVGVMVVVIVIVVVVVVESSSVVKLSFVVT